MKKHIFIWIWLPLLLVITCCKGKQHTAELHDYQNIAPAPIDNERPESTQAAPQKTITLQQLAFKDPTFAQMLTEVTNSYCFKETEYYILDFFKSDLSGNYFYLLIDRFGVDTYPLEPIGYYIIINKGTFFVPKNVPKELFNIQPVYEIFVLAQETPYPGGDYRFIIFGTLSGHYKILASTCAE